MPRSALDVTAPQQHTTAITRTRSAGTVLVAPGLLGWSFPSNAARTRTNIHFAPRVIVPLDGSSLVFRTADGRTGESRGPVLVPPGVTYATLSAGPRLGLTVHPVRDGRRLQVGAEPTILDGRAGDRVRGVADALLATRPDAEAEDAHVELLGGLDAPRAMVDRRVLAVLEALAFDREPPSLEALAARIALSPDRLRHLVVDSLGVGLRRLVQWYRFTHALVRLWRPEKLARIAVETGFCDHSHLARTTRELLGHPPSLRTALEWRIHGAYHFR